MPAISRETRDEAPTHQDRVFREPITSAEDFKFGQKVVKAFDDMVNRSVPFYGEIQRMISEIAADFATEGTNVYDLGCATGTSLLALDQTVPENVRFVGVDNSSEMLGRCRQKLEEQGMKRDYDLVHSDLNEGLTLSNASLVLMVLTLQFVRPLRRERLVSSILEGLNPNGCLILVEKVLGEDSIFNRLFIKYYYELKKKQGYSELEIAQKREALENVLVPYKLMENRDLLLQAGFRYCDVFFKWYNFSAMIAIK